MPALIDSTHPVSHSNILEDELNTRPFRLEFPLPMPIPWVDSPGETILAFSQLGMNHFRPDSQVCLCTATSVNPTNRSSLSLSKGWRTRAFALMPSRVLVPSPLGVVTHSIQLFRKTVRRTRVPQWCLARETQAWSMQVLTNLGGVE